MSGSENSVASSAVKSRQSVKREIHDCTEEPGSKRKRKTSDSSDLSVFWSESEIAELIETIQKQAPKSDKTYKHIQPLLKWDSITIGNHSPESCRKKLEFIISKVRKERSFLELVNAAKAINNNGRLLEYPDDMPKKPLGGLFMYFQERFLKLKAKHPDWPSAELKKQAREDLKNLSARKKAKMKARYEAELAEYYKALTEWKKKHPEFEIRSKTQPGLPRITSPLSLFVESKCESEKHDNPALPLAELKTKYRKRWKNMKDKKKYKYLNMAVKARIQYDKDLAEYCKLHPDYKPPKVRIGFLTHDEWKIKQKLDGLPEAAPRNALLFFVAEKMKQNPGLDKMTLNAEWKELSESERLSYVEQFRKHFIEYVEKVQQCLDNLDEDEKKVYKDWLDWTAIEKTLDKIRKGAIKEKVYEKQTGSKDDDAKNNKEKKKRKQSAHEFAETFPGAPQKPPGSGYQLFCTNLLRESKDLPNRERMAFCAQEWKKADKQKYNKMYKKLRKKYLKAVQEYLMTLPTEAAEEFLQHKSKKLKKRLIVDLLHTNAFKSVKHSPESVENHINAVTEPATINKASSRTDKDEELSPILWPSSPGSAGCDQKNVNSSSSSFSSEDDDSDEEVISLTSEVKKLTPEQNDRQLKGKGQQKKCTIRINLSSPKTHAPGSSSKEDELTSSNKKKRRHAGSPSKGQMLTHIMYESFSDSDFS